MPVVGVVAAALCGTSDRFRGINAAGALCLYLTIRALRRSPTWQLGAALGAVAEAAGGARAH